ncbi:MAG: ABC transporter permease [Armatimonadota bacterium]|nr:ABC transporter permease [Armatimonadota bacterium]
MLSYGLLVLAFFYLPLALLVLFSFNRSEIGSFPITGFSLVWYQRLFEDLFVQDAFRNSLAVATLATMIATPIGALGAFGLVRGRFRFKPVFTSLMVVPMVVPGLLIGIALLIVFVPIFRVGLSLWTAALGHVVILTPYAVLVVATRLYGFDRSLEAAAADLGATPLRVFWHVTLPLIMPGILAAALIVFTLSLDQFGVTFFTIGAEGTLPMYIWAQIEGGVKPTINALGTLFMAGSLLILLVAQVVLARRAG